MSDEHKASNGRRRIPVALYAPNLLGYARIILSFVGLAVSPSSPTMAVFIWYFSAFLDLFDGILARRLDQCSSFGILLDIAADNVLRTCLWIAGADPTFSACFIALEWTTMVCTQLSATTKGHWKKSDDVQRPRIVAAVFANNFRGPLGILSIYGMFAASGFAYGSRHEELYTRIPLFAFWKYLAYVGRGLSMMVEIWLCKEYISQVLEKDEADRDSKESSASTNAVDADVKAKSS